MMRNETDLLDEQVTPLVPVEIRSGRTLTHEALAGLHKWCARDKACAPALIFAGDESYRHKGIEVLGERERGHLPENI
jgi:hypothetical protein